MPARIPRLACYNARVKRVVLGVDPGTKRIGLACSDEDAERAHPVRTLARTDDASAARAIAEEAKRAGAGEVVVGLPLRLDGTEGDSAKRARALAAKLESAGLRVTMWDERLTTAAAERTLKEQGLDASERRVVVDQVAATMLLQSYLDALTRKAALAKEDTDWASDETAAPDAAPPGRPRRADGPRSGARRRGRSAG
jgi:putative Holliday junction resolvase